MKLLVCCDDEHHPGGVVRSAFGPLALAQGWHVDGREGEPLPEPEALARFDVVVLARSNLSSALGPEGWLGPSDASLRDRVRAGGGLLVVHSGLAGHAAASATRALSGGAFLSHPPACDIVIEARAGHALTQDVPSRFTVFDEHYAVSVDDPLADVFLTTRSSHGLQPAGWTRREGRGRVCALTPGHFAEVWLHPGFQRLLVNAVHWLADATDQR
jgi:hypothetical protein